MVLKRGFIAVLVLAALAIPVRAHASSTDTTAAVSAPCGQGSWIAGTVDLCAGELVYRDYVYDDFGARGQTQTVPTNDAYGGYPPSGGQKDDDQADLVALRLHVDSAHVVHVTAELNTMLVPDAAKFAIAVDNIPNAGGGAWPGFANLRSDGWDEIHVATQGDPPTNKLKLSFNQPVGATWRLWAVVAKADGTPMNVAFRGVDEFGAWWENEQANALAKGDITNFSTTVTVGDLLDGKTARMTVPPGHVRERVYVSNYVIGQGEGVNDNGVPGPAYVKNSPAATVSQAFTMLGKYQPYGFYEPPGPAPHGAQLVLHGLEENHSARLFAIGTGATTSFVQRFGDDRNRILASPLGRGWKGWYSSYSERDVLDVLADVEANYSVDTKRVELSGYSMGGYGALRIGALHPDVFAGIVNWVGWTGDEFNGTPIGDNFSSNGSNGGSDVNALDLLASLRHVPMTALYSGADELVNVAGALDERQRLADLRVPSIFYLHPAADHLTYALLDDWRKESNDSADDVLVRRPSHVVFRTDRSLFYPDVQLVPDHAYWVSRIVPAADGYADVDAVSFGCGNDEPVTAVQQGTGTDPVPWVSQTVAVTGTSHQAKAQRLELTLHNVSSVRIDAHQACLANRTTPVQVIVHTDTPVTVTLSNGQVVKAG